MLSFVSVKSKLIVEIFSKNSSCDDSVITLPAFPSRTYLKLHNIYVTFSLVKEFVNNLYSSKMFGLGCIPVVLLKNCKFELWFILAALFNMCLRESCFPDCLKVSSVVHVFNNVGENFVGKCTTLLVFSLLLVKSSENL